MKLFFHFLGFILINPLLAQSTIQIDSLEINLIDRNGKKQGEWRLYRNDSLAMTCRFVDDHVVDTISYYSASKLAMQLVPIGKNYSWLLFGQDTLSGYTARNSKNHMVYHYADSTEVEEETRNKITKLGEIMAAYYGGTPQLKKDLTNNYNGSIPSGRYLVTIVVDKNGEIAKVNVLTDTKKKTKKEIEALVKGLNRWQPAHQRGKMVMVSFTIPIKF